MLFEWLQNSRSSISIRKNGHTCSSSFSAHFSIPACLIMFLPSSYLLFLPGPLQCPSIWYPCRTTTCPTSRLALLYYSSKSPVWHPTGKCTTRSSLPTQVLPQPQDLTRNEVSSKKVFIRPSAERCQRFLTFFSL